MIFLLDANVVSELWKPEPDAALIAWMEAAAWYLPAPVVAEIQEGATAAPAPARREEINRKLEAFLQQHGQLVVSFDADCARIWGRLRHSPEVKRQPQALWDSLIDAMAVRYQARVATRNTTDFRHAETFNPWLEALPEDDGAGEELLV